MPDRSNRRDVSAFERALRAWGRRPPVLPAGSAAARIDDRLDRRERRLPYWRLVAAAATVVAVVGGLWLVSLDGPGAPERVESSDPSTGPTAPPLGDNVVLWWLDPETPVYFVIDSPDSGGGQRP
jgi:hypothetical protein